MILILIGLSIGFLSAQKVDNIKFDRLTSENIKLEKGLSQNWIYDILQDQHGYMWFGTWDGLNRYDGYNFTIYNEENGLSDHTIYSFLEDKDGFLWITTDNGFNKFDRKTQAFRQFYHIPEDTNSLINNIVNCIIEDDEGYLWLGTAHGLSRFNKKTEEFISFFNSWQGYNSPRSNYIIHLYQDRKKIIWISTSYGLVKFNPKSFVSTRYYHVPNDTNSLSNNNVRCVMQDRDGNYWIGTRNGLNYYDTTFQTIKKYFHDPNNLQSISDNSISVIFEDKSGKIWVGTENSGLNCFDRSNDVFIRYKNAVNKENSLSNNKVYSIFEDNSENLWVGTYNGVNKINKFTNDFKHIRQTSEEFKSPNNNVIWDFAEDNNENLWIATGEGVNIKNLNTGTFTYLLNHPGDDNSLIYDDVRTLLFSDKQNCMWFGTWGEGLDKYDLQNKQFTHYVRNVNRNSLSNNIINDLLPSNDSSLWIASGWGLNKLNLNTNQFEVFYRDNENKNSLSNNICISLFEDRKGDLWIGTDKGVNLFDKINNKFIRFFDDISEMGEISNNTIFAIHEDVNGKIWLGTSGGGMICLDPKTEAYDVFTTDDGLPNNVIYGFVEDFEGNLWVSTNLGLSKFYLETKRFVNYDVKDGIQSNEFNLGAKYKSRNGEIYFGGMNGYNFFNPVQIRYNPKAPVMVVSSFRMFNEVQKGELFNGDTIVLGNDDNFFSFEISALDYTNPSKNSYKYRLTNIDIDWVQTSSENRLAEYKKVRPGTYTFQAMGTNNDGVWNEKEFALTIIIKPPWYGTWFFRILMLVLFFGGLYSIYYRRVQHINKRHEEKNKLLEIEKQMFDLEQKALRLQMNPHFIFNSLNSIQSYILAHDIKKAVGYLGKFSQLMRLILSNSVNKFTTLFEELKSVRYYLDLERLRFDNKFDYSITIDPAIDEEFIEIPPMIIQPYIENAVIHGLIKKTEQGKIDIHFYFGDDILYCEIIDNGIGREASMKLMKESGINRQSKGMLITKARLEILKRQSKKEYSVKVIDLMDENNKPSGTKVLLKIHYKDI
jgi:ligand-binding sensor domain-containing protein